MRKSIFLKENIATWVCLGFQVLYNFSISTILIAKNNSGDASIWLMFGALASFLFVIELGFTPTIQRYAAYIKANNYNSKFFKIKKFDISELIFSSSGVYLIISFISTVVLLFLGNLILSNLFSISGDLLSSKQAFYFFLLKTFFYINSIGPNAIIQGWGKFSLAKTIEGFHFFLKCLIIPLIFFKDISLVTIIIYDSCITFLWCILCRYYAFKLTGLELSSFLKLKLDFLIIKELSPTSFKWGGMQLGGYFINYSSNIAVAQLKNPEIIASFLLTSRVINFIRTFSATPVISHMPNIFELFSKNKLFLIKDLLYEKIRTSLFLFVFLNLALIIMLIGIDFFSLLNPLSSYSIILFLFIMGLFELQHGLHAQIYMGSNEIPFVIPSLVSAALILLGHNLIDDLTIIDIISIQFFVQLSCNNWHPIYMNTKLLKFNISSYLKNIFLIK